MDVVELATGMRKPGKEWGAAMRDAGCKMQDDASREAPDKLTTLNAQPSTVTHLPRCLDMISAEEVVRRVELYFSGGAVDFLTAEQAAVCAGIISGPSA